MSLNSRKQIDNAIRGLHERHGPYVENHRPIQILTENLPSFSVDEQRNWIRMLSFEDRARLEEQLRIFRVTVILAMVIPGAMIWVPAMWLIWSVLLYSLTALGVGQDTSGDLAVVALCAIIGFVIYQGVTFWIRVGTTATLLVDPSLRREYRQNA